MKKEDVYNVEKIADSRVMHGKKQYFIKWEGYPEEFNTWEYEKDIFCKDLIVAYEKLVKDTPSTPKSRKKARSSVASESPAKNAPVDSSGVSYKQNKDTDGIKHLSSHDSWEEMIDEVMTVQWNTASKRLDVQFKMKNGNVGVVPASDAHLHFPISLIRFYEKHISFQSDSDDEDHIVKT